LCSTTKEEEEEEEEEEENFSTSFNIQRNNPHDDKDVVTLKKTSKLHKGGDILINCFYCCGALKPGKSLFLLLVRVSNPAKRSASGARSAKTLATPPP
jgi:hypothetical protein